MPVGECVVLHGDGRADPLSAAAVDCDGSMSYAVATHTDITDAEKIAQVALRRIAAA